MEVSPLGLEGDRGFFCSEPCSDGAVSCPFAANAGISVPGFGADGGTWPLSRCRRSKGDAFMWSLAMTFWFIQVLDTDILGNWPCPMIIKKSTTVATFRIRDGLIFRLTNGFAWRLEGNVFLIKEIFTAQIWYCPMLEKNDSFNQPNSGVAPIAQVTLRVVLFCSVFLMIYPFVC